WALVSGVPGGAHGGRLARLRACTTLAAAGRSAQLRHVLKSASLILPPDAPGQLMEDVRGARPYDLLTKILNAQYAPEAIPEKLRGAHQVAHGRAIVRDVLEPPWRDLAIAHRTEPLPWGAAVALLEHARCPAALQAVLLKAHPRAVPSVSRPGPEVLAICHELGEDQLTKKVLLRGIAAGTVDAGQLITEVRPARIALTALVHGDLDAVATQAAAISRVRHLVLDRLAVDPHAWQTWYAALPTCTGTAAELLTTAGTPATGEELPRLGRQSAWAYTTLIDIAGPEHAPHALEFLDDARLAPLAGVRGVPRTVADHVAAHGGPVARRVLAGNPDLRVEVLEKLVLGGDRAIASAAYRHPRCTMPLRQYILAADGIDDELRAELLTAFRLHELWPLLASPDPALLRHAACASDREDGRMTRLRAAYRLAELHGFGALEGLPDHEVALTRRHERFTVLRSTLDRFGRFWPKILRETHYLPRPEEPDGVHGALADPGLAWGEVLADARRGKLSAVVLNRLVDRPDCPTELARIHRDGSKSPLPDRTVAVAQAVVRHRALAVEVLAKPPVVWSAPGPVLDSGAVTPEEFVASGDASQVVDTAAERVPVARVVARLLHDTLGDAVDAWVVLARLLEQRPAATLAELASTARAAA
ncbi:MAG: hypothetical protein HOU01_14865, partial [Streptomycetaceae bacterium]|nr:hypothetical protein [Streptomycetaceae bacterium]